VAKKRTMAPRRKQDAGLRVDVLEAIERVWPDGVVDMTFDSEESYFWDVHPRLTRAFQRIKGVRLLREREADGGPIWWGDSDPDEDPPDDITHSRSYHLFFVSPEGEAFTFETETEEIDEEAMAEEFDETGLENEPMITVSGQGRTGWSVAVSLLAPFAVISLGDMATFEDGTTDEPAIERYVQTEEGDQVDLEADFQKSKGEQAFQVLQDLRGTISGILEKHGISVLEKEEWSKPVPWLRGGEEAFVSMGHPIRVLDAFFFEGL